MGRIVFSTVAVCLLAATPATAQHAVADARVRVHSLVGGAFGDGAFIATGAGIRVKATSHVGLELELAQLSGMGGTDHGDIFSSIGPVPEVGLPLFGWSGFQRPRRDLTTLLTKVVVEFPVADGRLFPYLSAGGGVGRVTGGFGPGAGLIPGIPADIFYEPSTIASSASDPGFGNGTGAVHFVDSVRFPAFGDYSEVGLGLSLGGGVDVRLWRGLGVGVDVRWLRVLLSHDHIDVAQVGANVSYRF